MRASKKKKNASALFEHRSKNEKKKKKEFKTPSRFMQVLFFGGEGLPNRCVLG